MNKGGGAQSLLDLDLGFLALPRRLWGSDWFRSLPPLEKLAVIDTLMCGRYANGGEFYFAGQRVPLAVGQFIDSDEERARRLGFSRKVIRDARRKMKAAGLVSHAQVHPAGRCPFVTTVLNYERIQLAREVAGQRTEPRADQHGASSGPVEGQQRAPSEQGLTKEPGNLSLVAEAPASDDAGPLQRVLEVWNRVAVPAGFAKARATPQQRKAARTRMREAGWFEAFAAACEHAAAEPFYRGGGSSGWVLTLSWLLKPGNAEKTAERAATRKAPAAGSGAPARDIRVGFHEPSPPEAFEIGENDLTSCSEWGRVRDVLRQRMRAESFQRLAQVRCYMEAGVLVLRAPTEYEANFLRDEWLEEPLTKVAREVLGAAVELRVEAPSERAAGGTP